MTGNAATMIPRATIAVGGLLAGASLDQSIKQLPARERMGALAFAHAGVAAATALIVLIVTTVASATYLR